MRYELSDYEWAAIKPMLPNKPRGVRRVNDRRVLNGIFWVLRSGAPWRDLPETYGPRTTCYNQTINCCGGFSINTFVVPAGMTETLIEARQRERDVAANP